MDTRKTGLLISDIRREKGLTQKELAARLHVSDRTVSKWERGAGFPDVTMLEPLSDELGVPVQCLLSGERETNRDMAQNDHAVRDAIKFVYKQYRQKTRRNISRIIASAFLLALSGFFIFGMLDYSGAFLRDISCEIPAVIYENGVEAGETTVFIDGAMQVLGDRNFQGRFHIEAVEATGREDTIGYIQWDQIAEGFQQISYFRPGFTFADVGIERYLYISPDMRHFALELEDGRIIATNAPLAALQAIKRHRYALSYEYENYPYFSYMAS